MLTDTEKLILSQIYDNILISNERINNEGRNVTTIKVDGKWTLRQTSALRLESHLGRKLQSFETVDHIDGDKQNDDISNLQVLSRSENILKAHNSGVYDNNRKLFVEYLNSGANSDNVSGDLNGMAKISNDEVKRYRLLFKNMKISKSQIMFETGMSRRAVENFLNYRSFKHI